MMKLHGCSTAAPATSFALPCAELLARQRACTARATRLALVSARSRIAAALRVTPVCRIVAAHEHVRHRPVMCMYKTNFLSELQSQPSFSIDQTRTRSLWRKNLTRCTRIMSPRTTDTSVILLSYMHDAHCTRLMLLARSGCAMLRQSLDRCSWRIGQCKSSG